jgi:chromosome segregation ATPase
LRKDTLRCISISAKGKIEVADAGLLERLNADIDVLRTQREAMERAINTLATQEPGFLHDMEEQARKLQKVLDDAPIAINRQLATEITSFDAPSIEVAQKSHRFLRAKEDFERRMADAKAKLAELEPRIELVRSHCEAALGC